MQNSNDSIQEIQAVCFDFDGTLIDAYPAISASVNHLRARRGLPPISETEVRKYVGRGPAYLISNTVGADDVEEDLQEYRRHHPTVMMGGSHLLPGAAELVRRLKQSGRYVGLCSNKPAIFSHELLKKLELYENFDVVLGPEDVPRPKPAPDMLLDALVKLEVAAENTLYIGDMSVDIETARGAGVSVWVVPTGSETIEQLEAAAPDRVLQDLVEAIDILQLS